MVKIGSNLAAFIAYGQFYKFLKELVSDCQKLSIDELSAVAIKVNPEALDEYLFFVKAAKKRGITKISELIKNDLAENIYLFADYVDIKNRELELQLPRITAHDVKFIKAKNLANGNGKL